jgi:hypothetical protein
MLKQSYKPLASANTPPEPSARKNIAKMEYHASQHYTVPVDQ